MKTTFATAAALLLAYAALLQVLPRLSEPKVQSQWQESRLLIERYVRDAAATPVVVVGTSLSRRLHFDAEGCVYNLAFSGESALTGLALIDAAGLAPRAVYVEINHPERGPSAALVAHAGDWRTRLPPWRTENIPSNRLYSALASGGPPRPPSALDLQRFATVVAAELPRRQAEYARAPDPAALAAQLAQFRHAVARLQARGTTVVFFEMPVHRALLHSARAEAVRQAFRQAFAQHRLLAAEALAAGRDLPTEDTVHLQRDAAQAVAETLQQTMPCPGAGDVDGMTVHAAERP